MSGSASLAVDIGQMRFEGIRAMPRISSLSHSPLSADLAPQLPRTAANSNFANHPGLLHPIGRVVQTTLSRQPCIMLQ
jgi:hypothetical protein